MTATRRSDRRPAFFRDARERAAWPRRRAGMAGAQDRVVPASAAVTQIPSGPSGSQEEILLTDLVPGQADEDDPQVDVAAAIAEGGDGVAADM